MTKIKLCSRLLIAWIDFKILISKIYNFPINIFSYVIGRQGRINASIIALRKVGVDEYKITRYADCYANEHIKLYICGMLHHNHKSTFMFTAVSVDIMRTCDISDESIVDFLCAYNPNTNKESALKFLMMLDLLNGV